VAIGIGGSAQTFRSGRGVNIWGVAEVFTEDTQEFAHGMKFFSRILKDLEKEMGTPIEIPKGILRMIRVTPTKMVYSPNKGISNAHGEAE